MFCIDPGHHAAKNELKPDTRQGRLFLTKNIETQAMYF